jgi:Putative metal-binding motif
MPLTAQAVSPGPHLRFASRLCAVAMLLSPITCGRTQLYVGPAPPLAPECNVDADCPGADDKCAPSRCEDSDDHPELLEGIPVDLIPNFSLPPRVCLVLDEVDCDDGDICTEDSCDSETGECGYGPATLDLDEDGFRAPLPGTRAGEPDSCGDDCNDASADAFPGNPETCDGVDNDCNGVVDDGANFIPLDVQPVKVSENSPPYSPGGLAFDGEDYMSIYTSANSNITLFSTQLLPDGTKVPPIEQNFNLQNADASGGPIIWVGDRYGVAWQDRREGVYEVFFTLLDSDGDKVIPDTRLSFDNSIFSVNVDMTWNGSEFIVAWQDDLAGPFQIRAQRVSVDGDPIGNTMTLTSPGGAEDESPSLASGEASLGLAFTNGVASTSTIRFQTFEQTTLEPRSEVVNISPTTGKAVYPQVVWNEDRYLVTWYERNTPPFAVYAATVDEDGLIITPAQRVSEPSDSVTIARSPTVLPLGDRALFVYAHNRDDPQGRHELYSRMVDAQLVPAGPELRLTNAPQDSVEPIATFGPDGNVAIFFRDDRLGAPHVWLTRLDCAAGN